MILGLASVTSMPDHGPPVPIVVPTKKRPSSSTGMIVGMPNLWPAR